MKPEPSPPKQTRRNRIRIATALAVACTLAGSVALVRITRTAQRGDERGGTDETPTSSAQDAKQPRFVAGDVFTYALAHEAAIDAAEGGRMYHLDAAGEWIVHVIDVQKDRVQFAASLKDATLASTRTRPGQEPEYAAVAAELAKPMFYTLDARGSVDEVRFEPDASRAAIDLFRSVLALGQVTFPDKPKARWVPTESDATGKYLAEYRQLAGAGRVSKQKQRYIEVLTSSAAIGAELAVDVIASSGELTLDASGVLEGARIRDAVRTRTQLLPELTSTTSLTLSRKSKTRDLAAARALRERAARLDALALHETPPTRDSESAIDRAKVNGRKLGDFVKEFAALPSLEGATLEQRDRSRRLFVELAAVFRLDEAAVDQAMATILSGSEVGPVLWDALASAGTPKAQAALRELIENPRFDADDRRTQMIGLSFVDTPTKETVEFLFAKVDDAEQGQQARFGIGTALNHLRGKDDGRVESGVAALGRQLAAATSHDDVSDYLRALGNAGVLQGKPIVTPYLQDENATVRAAAANALRYMPGDEVVTTLRTLIEQDDSGLVRANAVRAAGDRPPDRALLDAVYQASIGDHDKIVREQAEDTLRRWGENYPPIGEALAAFKASQGQEAESSKSGQAAQTSL